MNCKNDRRNAPRYRVKAGILAVLGPESDKLGPIVDISRGGLAFSYNPTAMPSDEGSELTILFDDVIINFNNPTYRFNTRIVFEKALENPDNSSANTKRICAVQFQKLTYHQNSWLGHFIQNHTLENNTFRMPPSWH